ncbi:MAG: DUF1828 domain-containing protein [Sulfuricurvum sp.]|nr:DUF1828 domain-containing protein [Sulfuricurvum sp.]
MHGIDNLVNKYIDFIKENMSIDKIDDTSYEIETPFLDRRNDFITIYVIFDKQDKNNIMLTDNGYTLSDLELSGLEFNTQKRKQELQTVLNGFGVRLDKEKRLFVNTTAETFAQKKHNLIQALLSVNDMFVLAQNKVMNLFYEDVGYYFDENDIRYAPNVILEGKSHFNHKFEYIIPKSKNAPERTIKLLNRPKAENLKATLFAFEDTGDKRNGKGYIILNDEESIKTDLIEAINEYKITPILWSQKNSFKEELAA